MNNGYLLDTSFLSELSPGRQALPDSLNVWVIETFSEFYLSTISVAEIAAGIAKLRRTDRGTKADAYEAWLTHTLALFGSRLLDLDQPAARKAGELGDLAISKGRHPGFADVAIAATAQSNGLIVLTRNLKHFVPLDVPCLDPFKMA